jgi:hypothetical protein
VAAEDIEGEPTAGDDQPGADDVGDDAGADAGADRSQANLGGFPEDEGTENDDARGECEFGVAVEAGGVGAISIHGRILGVRGYVGAHGCATWTN